VAPRVGIAEPQSAYARHVLRLTIEAFISNFLTGCYQWVKERNFCCPRLSAVPHPISPFGFVTFRAAVRKGQGRMWMNGSVPLECAHTERPEATIRTGKIAVNLEQRIVTVDGNPVPLTPRVYEILEFLSLRKGMVRKRESD